MGRFMADWLAVTLSGSDSTNVKLKSLGIINDMASNGSMPAKSAVARACFAGVEIAKHYECENHPQYGDKPKQFVRAKAAECLAVLQIVQASPLGAGKLCSVSPIS